MRLKGLFWILTTLLLTILAVVTYYVFYTSSIRMFFAVEALVLLTIIYLFVFYRRIIKPLHIIGNGMELLKEQDFSSRLGKVGQTEADRVVDVFNKMMEQLKNERLHLGGYGGKTCSPTRFSLGGRIGTGSDVSSANRPVERR